jgi:hypothetical protein
MSTKGKPLLTHSQAGFPPRGNQTASEGNAMSAIRKIVLSVAALLLGLSATATVTATATAEVTSYSVQCDNDWHVPCH